MARFKLLTVCLLLLTASAWAAPELSQADRQRLADGTTDRDAVLDQQDGLYVLLRNASTWQGDDFGGDAGAAVAPPPDYSYIKDKPQQARGNVYLIEGWLVGADRYPTLDNHDRDKLMRAGNPDWGDRVTRWTIVTEKGNAQATLLVLFNDPNAQIKAPAKGTELRIAARFYKLWTINDVSGKPFTYPVFVGGAHDIVAPPRSTGSSGPWNLQTAIFAIAGVVAVFFILRWMLGRLHAGGGQRTRELIETRRSERESHGEDAEDEDIDDLPDDPIAALDMLRQKHESD